MSQNSTDINVAALHPVDRARYRVYKNRRLAFTLRCIGGAAVALSVVAYVLRTASFFSNGVQLGALAFFILSTAAPFVAVSCLRAVINAPRPYEVIEFYTEPPKNKSGRSFPSRHVFSIFLIAASSVLWQPQIAVTLAVLGVLLAACRVLLGIHYVKDTVAGALIGTVCGVIGALVMHFVL